MYDGLIIDVHTHIQLDEGTTIRSEPHREADYWAAAEPIGIRNAGALVIAFRGQPDAMRLRNDAVLALVRQDHRFHALCSVHPDDGDAAIKEVDRVSAAGAAGLKLHPNTQDFDVASEAVIPVVRRAAERGLPVLFDAYSPWDPAQPGKFVKLAMAVPDAKLILAHAHVTRFLDLVVYDILRFYDFWTDNVWIDLSVAAALFADSPYAEQFAWTLKKVGASRILFGSDYPLDDPTEAVTATRALGFSDDEQRRIFHDNAAELYGI